MVLPLGAAASPWCQDDRPSHLAEQALREALEASRISHLDVEGDPFFSCPIARGGSCLRHDMDGQCPCGCNCGADEHNARIDAALAAAGGEGQRAGDNDRG